MVLAGVNIFYLGGEGCGGKKIMSFRNFRLSVMLTILWGRAFRSSMASGRAELKGAGEEQIGREI